MVRKKSIFQTYLYLVLAMSLLVGAINIGSAFWGATRVVFPHITVRGYEWKEIQRTPKKKQEIFASEKHDGMRSILLSLISLLIVIPIFLVHLLLLIRNRRRK